MGLMNVFKRVFTWWDGQTLGTQLWTSRNGIRVGEDEAGNVFYKTADGSRRWVIYNGAIEGSRVSPLWHGWLHHTWDELPTERPPVQRAWEKPHVPNLTGTDRAWVPPGSILRPQPLERRDYDAWTPE